MREVRTRLRAKRVILMLTVVNTGSPARPRRSHPLPREAAARRKAARLAGSSTCCLKLRGTRRTTTGERASPLAPEDPEQSIDTGTVYRSQIFSSSSRLNVAQMSERCFVLFSTCFGLHFKWGRGGGGGSVCHFTVHSKSQSSIYES